MEFRNYVQRAYIPDLNNNFSNRSVTKQKAHLGPHRSITRR
jgi:hypothetical protein